MTSPILASTEINTAEDRRAERLHRFAMRMWLLLAVVVNVKTFLRPLGKTVYSDFIVGSRYWWSGENPWADTGYYYSPTFAVLFSPFAMLPDWLGGILWNTLSIGMLVWSLRVFAREVLPKSWPRSSEAWFLLIAMVCSIRGIWSAQSTTLLLAMVLLAAVCILHSRWWSAALLLAGPVHIKVWPLALAAIVCVFYPKKLIARFCVALAALAAVPLLTNPPSFVAAKYTDWYQCLAARQAKGERYGGFRDVWTIWEQIHSPVNQRAYVALQLGGGLAVLLWCLWQKRRLKSTPQLLTYTIAAWSTWQMLLGPGTEVMTNIVIGSTMSWALITAYRQRQGRGLASTAFIVTFVLGQGEVGQALIKLAPACVALQPIGIFIFAAWLVRHAQTAPDWEQPAMVSRDQLPVPSMDVSAQAA